MKVVCLVDRSLGLVKGTEFADFYSSKVQASIYNYWIFLTIKLISNTT